MPKPKWDYRIRKEHIGRQRDDEGKTNSFKYMVIKKICLLL